MVPDDLALYVHWPFCLAKCPYCDFNSHVAERIDHEAWRRALVAEIDHYAALTPGRRLTSIFFGGGTPSLMVPETVAAVIDRAAGHWRPAPDIEITLEANPTSVEADRFQGFRTAGVNRVSLGVQALDDRDLAGLGRRHDAAEAMAAVDLATRCFPRVSFDLIYARPGQSVARWLDELERALAFGTEHLSVYQLTIEPGTKFHTLHARGELVLPDEETAATLYEATQARLEAAGLPAYEISNHARPGAECRHNLTYWRYGDYAGVGPGAHGRLSLADGRVATRAHRAPEIWRARVAEAGHGAGPAEPIDADTGASEMLMMGLRLAEGIPAARLAAFDAERLIDQDARARLVRGGFLEPGPDLRATAAAFPPRKRGGERLHVARSGR